MISKKNKGTISAIYIQTIQTMIIMTITGKKLKILANLDTFIYWAAASTFLGVQMLPIISQCKITPIF